MPVKQWQNKSGVKPKKCVQCVPTDLHSDSNYLEYFHISTPTMATPYLHGEEQGRGNIYTEI